MITSNIASLEDLDILFADYAQEILGLSQDKVLIQHTEKGQISSTINENVAYIHVGLVNDAVQNLKERKREFTNGKFKTTQHSMRIIELFVMFYGPDSVDLSTLLADSFFLECGKEFLYKNNLSLIPSSVTNGITLHERFNGQWWKRSDLKVQFYNSIQVSEDVNKLDSVDITYNVSSGNKTIIFEQGNGGNA